uniref:ATP-dependent dethiobiotin synthetase BioD n=1 Tax=Planktothricoides sp. SpSt-374 TaxID=2282167 RepID=A0A7C3VGD1_9CYAN
MNQQLSTSKKPKSLLITGTDTDAGKTVLTAALAAYWQRVYPHQPLGIIKPIQSGTGDNLLYQRLFDLDQSSAEINPVQFQAPLAPPIAAAKENRTVDLALAWRTFTALQERSSLVLVEALGGLGSPVTAETTVADLARDWSLPAVLVVPVKLGSIGQAVANSALAREAVGANHPSPLRGIILNCIHPLSDSEINDLTPVDLIQSLTNIPVCGILPHLNDPTDIQQLANAAANLNLETFLPGIR